MISGIIGVLVQRVERAMPVRNKSLYDLSNLYFKTLAFTKSYCDRANFFKLNLKFEFGNRQHHRKKNSIKKENEKKN